MTMMKKNLFWRLAAAALMLAMFIGTLGACGAKGSDNAMGYAPSEQEKGEADGMLGGDNMDGSANPGAGSDGEYDRKIVRTVNMSCETRAFDDAVSMIMAVLAAHGGYVENSSTSGGAARSMPYAETHSARYASYTMRVPAEQLDAFLQALRADGNIRVLSQEAKSQEITGSYYDTQTRLGALTAERDALTAMMASFDNYKDISAMLEVQRRLYDVIEEMEALQTKLSIYDSQVAMSTVALSLREVVEYTAVEEPSFGERISEAFTDSWADFAEGCQDFAVWFVASLPGLLVFAVVAGVIVTVIVVVWKRKRKGKD